MIRYDSHGHKKECKSYIHEDNVNHDASYYFEIYNDSLIAVEEVERGDGNYKTVWVDIIVDGAAYLMHQRKYEAGRPHLRKNVEALAETLRDVRRSFRDTALSVQVVNPGNIEDILG